MKRQSPLSSSLPSFFAALLFLTIFTTCWDVNGQRLEVEVNVGVGVDTLGTTSWVDESSSNCDTTTEQIIQAAINVLLVETTSTTSTNGAFSFSMTTQEIRVLEDEIIKAYNSVASRSCLLGSRHLALANIDRDALASASFDTSGVWLHVDITSLCKGCSSSDLQIFSASSSISGGGRSQSRRLSTLGNFRNTPPFSTGEKAGGEWLTVEEYRKQQQRETYSHKKRRVNENDVDTIELPGDDCSCPPPSRVLFAQILKLGVADLVQQGRLQSMSISQVENSMTTTLTRRPPALYIVGSPIGLTAPNDATQPSFPPGFSRSAFSEDSQVPTTTGMPTSTESPSTNETMSPSAMSPTMTIMPSPSIPVPSTPVPTPSLPTPDAQPSTIAPANEPTSAAPVSEPSLTIAPDSTPSSTTAPVTLPTSPAPDAQPSTPAPDTPPTMTTVPVTQPSSPAPDAQPSTPAPDAPPTSPEPVAQPPSLSPDEPTSPAPDTQPTTSAPVPSPASPEPVAQPPSVAPDEPPSTTPPVTEPTSPAPDSPPTTSAPVTSPEPVAQPPSTMAPVEEPTLTPAPDASPSTPAPVEEPSTNPPVSEPPSTPAPDEEPSTNPPVSEPPSTPAPVEEPSTNPPVSEPPSTPAPVEEPSTNPPVSEPPSTPAPVEEPSTSPPVSEPPSTEAPVTPPPSEAPVTLPPSQAPITQAPTQAPEMQPSNGGPGQSEEPSLAPTAECLEECCTDRDCTVEGQVCFVFANRCIANGSLRFTLSWEGDDDLDLYVETPDGVTLSFRNPYDAASGGRVGEDTNQLEFDQHVENTYFPDTAPEGVYTFYQVPFNSREEDDTWTLSVYVDGVLEFTVSGTGLSETFEYTHTNS